MNINEFRKLEYLSGIPFLITLTISGIILFVFIYNLIYSGKIAKIISTVLFLISSVTLLGFFIYLKPYNNLISLNTAATRSYQYVFGYKKFYLKNELSLYQKGYFLDTFEENPLYEYIEEYIPVEYLGKYNEESFFKFNEDIIFTYKKINFSKVDNSNIVIRQYFLKDKEYINEGFIEKSPKFFIKYEVPKNLETLTFDNGNNKTDTIYDKSYNYLIHTLSIKYP
ncbi:hypothetical protein [Miniphocaeibacter halophilus]|uniref:Uncharacterized protein n=1 Tax=Miniphocaeibacter halophilus TaxID=2931922 RepID=A0AC61MUW0_9FIRM|nr:hypothetical protein [Miniphocaeibacter halophilus]QQK07954.1 hypothetical protein JFY71_11925 [Miniphocaeibacter halophilus]